MNIIPELNLNEHPKDVKDGSLIDAVNMQINKDSFILETENTIKNKITNEMIDYATNIDIRGDKSYKLITYIPCNKEVVLIYKITVNNSDTGLYFIYRYDEETNNIKICRQIDIKSDSSEFTSTFTYNKGELIIAISEFKYDDSINEPLKVINLGKFEDISNIDITNNDFAYIDSIIPKVKIPTIQNEIVNGSAYKGWYYIFIRYKLSNNNYTQWYNTNSSQFIDSFTKEFILNYTAVKGINDNPTTTTMSIDSIISDSKDTCNITFESDIINIDTRYKQYQLGYINITKSKTSCFRTKDININNNDDNNINKIVFNIKSVIEENITDMINTYFNYYNTKSLVNYNNALYISNYKEINLNKNITDSITINLNISQNKLVKIAEGSDITIKATSKTDTSEIYNLKGKVININGTNYNAIPFTNLLVNTSSSTIQLKEFKNRGRIEIRYDAHLVSSGAIAENTFILIDRIDKTNTNKTLIVLLGEDGSLIGYINNGDAIISIKNITDAYDFNTTYFLQDGIYNFNYSIINGGVDYNPDNDDNTLTGFSENVLFDYSKTCLKSNNIDYKGLYNFYIHFVDEYGIITNGYPINKFNLNLGTGINTIKDTDLIKFNNINNTDNLLCSINNIPNDYIGYFISYEKYIPIIDYKGYYIFHNGYIYFYCDKLFTKDIIDLSFDKIRLFTGSNDIPLSGGNNPFITEKEINSNGQTIESSQFKGNINITFNNTQYEDLDAIDKQLLLPDVYNNICKSGCIKIKVGNQPNIIERGIAYCYKSEEEIKNKYYKNKIKTLIPCSNIGYKDEIDNIDTIVVNTKNSFNTKLHSLKYKDGSIYLGSQFIFQYAVESIFNLTDSFARYPAYSIDVFDYDELPYESFSINNAPVPTFYPLVEGNNTRYYQGNITELKNTIDLYKQNNVTYYDMYPKVLLNYNEDIKNLDTFSKTIRRSNIIQDESDKISWRFFETDAYKNIIENKGDIIKLTAIGNIILVHTEHSLFQFRADAVLLTQDENNVNIGNNDIFKLDYKEVFTSTYGYDGLIDHKHSISGSFGYIWYSHDSHKIFRYDNNSVEQIDININKFIREMELNNIQLHNVIITNDIDRNRLIFAFNDIGLSYNYKYNVFVSYHERDYIRGFNTKTTTYLLNNNNNYELYNFDDNKHNYSKQYCSILVNTDYPINKVLESIRYSLSLIHTAAFIWNKFDKEYSGEELRIVNNNCDTGTLDITFNKDNLNSVKVPNKPYRYGTDWNFNFIRNNISAYPNIQSDNSKQVYGKWFVFTFTFTSDTLGTNALQLESIDCKFTKRIS